MPSSFPSTRRVIPHEEYFPTPRGPLLPTGWLAVLAHDLRELARFAPVIANLVHQDLRVRYQRSVLGFFWTLLNPILMMTTMTLVFANLLGRDGDWRNYAIYLFAGQVPWGLLAGSLSDCALSIIANEALIRKIYVPKLVFPISRVLFHVVNFALSLTALFLLLVPLGARPSWSLLMLPICVALLAAFSLGLGILIAVLNTFYRDLGHLVGVTLQAWYFMTPILYEASRFRTSPWFLALNPAYPFIRPFQVILRDGQWPDPCVVGVSAVLAISSLGIGYAVYKGLEHKLVFRL
ncbi:MAG: transport permease protein [Isosphaeraceae bacterium]|nr:MAG: transport permease protein [Isosphaeraceae bacterium]